MLMPHKRSITSKLEREARKLALNEAFWDRERRESVSLKPIKVVGIEEGEVLYNLEGYVSPSISPDPYHESYLWLKAHGLV